MEWNTDKIETKKDNTKKKLKTFFENINQLSPGYMTLISLCSFEPQLFVDANIESQTRLSLSNHSVIDTTECQSTGQLKLGSLQ